MTDLYSYCIPCDDGAAPNPFEGVCTLVICKPRIRRKAAVGDWIVGTGAKCARIDKDRSEDMSGRLVYAMQVTEKMSMADYDAATKTRLPGKLPMWDSSAWWRKLGDSIYDYAGGATPTLREPCVHAADNVARDLSGRNALLSTNFYYFGDKAIELPDNLRHIAPNQQGHRRQLNESFVDDFVKWINGLGYAPCSVVGKPLYDPIVAEGSSGWGARWGASERLADSVSNPHIVDDEPVETLD